MEEEIYMPKDGQVVKRENLDIHRFVQMSLVSINVINLE